MRFQDSTNNSGFVKHLFFLLCIVLLSSVPTTAQTNAVVAPGGPGADAHWPGAAKNGFGTANTLRSKVWFTLSDGQLTEVYYPTLDTPNVQRLQLIVVTPDGTVETEGDDTTHALRVLDGVRSPSFRQHNQAKTGAYSIQKTYASDTGNDSLLIHVSFKPLRFRSGAYKLYVYYDPSLNNSGMHDTAWADGDALLASDGDKSSALIADPMLVDSTSGYLGASDVLTQLRTARNVVSYGRATDGNVVQGGRVNVGRGDGLSFTLSLGFGKAPKEALRNARVSLAKGFRSVLRDYEQSWRSYVSKLPRVGMNYQRQLTMAAITLRALEDKTYRGATIASPSIPWGGGPNANDPTISGYHAVWARDLYHVATALHAIGDLAGSNRALDYLFKIQQRADGSFPQNSRVDGKPIGGGLQMDQVALPIILAYQLRRTDKITWRKHLKPAADFIVRKGPATEQDRWEEKPGYSPATLAAEIAALVCAAHIAALHGDELVEREYLRTADEWAQNVEQWTATINGPHARDPYFLRITENNNPNDGARIEINSGGGAYDEREIVDAGFLELVRLGIRAAEDPLVLRSLAVVDKLIRVESSAGSAWYRYDHDAYGELQDGGDYDGRSGRGRLWSLLTGERGEFELARGDTTASRKALDTMMAFANEGLMIPEQVWDRRDSPSKELRFGSGTGSATPLAWSMAQFIRLAINNKHGRNLETPAIVRRRYRRK